MTKFTPQDIAFIKDLGHDDADIPQIKMAVRYTTYELHNKIGMPKIISRDEAIRLLSKETWLSGICRSAFHYTAARQTKDGKTVLFDSSKMFKR